MTKPKKVVFITGAADGIGFQLAKQLATKAKNSPSTDYLVVATALRLTEELEGLASCEDAVCRVLKMDVTDYKACEEVIQNVIQTEGKIDILVHCNSVDHFQAIERTTTNEARAVMETNVSGVINVTSLCVPHMKSALSGHIMAISSFCGIPFNSIYSASKCAVEGYCESIREELLADGIRVNVVEVGPVSMTTDPNNTALEQMTSCDDDDDDHKQLVETFKQEFDASLQTMGQSPKIIAQKMCTIIESSNTGQQQFRYETNEIYANALSPVYKEHTHIMSRLQSF